PALAPGEVRDQLRKRTTHLEAEIETYEQVLATVAPRIGRLNLVEVEYALALRRAELVWVKQITVELGNGKLKWDPETIRKQAAHFFTPDPPVDHKHRCT